LKVETTESFDRDFDRLPADMRDRARSTVLRMIANPGHPSLQLKKMRGLNVWEMRVTRSYRITLEINGDTWTLRRVGTHDVLRDP
jgi:mRNA-degrading endonuclease RelE of RelBE toxin-antitoxin system